MNTALPTGDDLHQELPEVWRVHTGRIIGCAIEVHRHLGPGLLEKVYEDAMEYELQAAGVAVQRQLAFRVPYKGVLLSEQRLDLLIEGRVVVELKCIEKVNDLHLAQLVSYLRCGNYPLGLLINFNVNQLKQGIYRRINSAASLSAPSACSAFKSNA
jgi:GxxExxY protein